MILLGLVGGGVAYAKKTLQIEPLPPVYAPRTCCLFPRIDFERTVVGQPEAIIRRGYGLAPEAAQEGKGCLRLKFGDQVITVLVEEGRVAGKWLGDSATSPAACQGLQKQSIDVVGVQCYGER